MKISIYQSRENRHEKITLVQDDELQFIKLIHTPDILDNDIVIDKQEGTHELLKRAWEMIHKFKL